MCTNEARNSYIYKPIIHLFTMIASVTINVTIGVIYIHNKYICISVSYIHMIVILCV